MKIDFSQLKDLDLEDLGSWPPLARGLFCVVLAGIIIALTYNLMVSDKIRRYDNEVAQEAQLKSQYQGKYAAAARLDVYKQQMIEAEEQFASLLKQLPTRHETPGLLDDITYVGTTSGLVFNRINWEEEVHKQFYTELPINIEVVGGYHDFGEFVSKVAALPRIVTVHDFKVENLTLSNAEENLILRVQAKTYRYRQQEESE